jgi:predicted nucleic acid-binding protein
VIVVVTNVIAYLVLKGDQSEVCSNLYEYDPDWTAPRLWRDELANVLATYERQNLLARQDALLAFQDAEAAINGNEFDISIDKILSVSARTGCTGYDAQYIALAEDLGLKLYTFDKRILQKAEELARRP